MPKNELATLLLKQLLKRKRSAVHMIAEVIVDVAAYPIDRPFDYIVPDMLDVNN